ncbi:sulfite exporter TauE/SafE family protein [Lentibacter sp. XHP0401]|uniref:sulfite exporter TauE/SafE family protein n=1 Tax=Lentibacter sp. XHP0401 TaxID=2984334 RepID=UPI0021E7353F|nr:sulfite exporter TauE/SafE family protein [Lentibacter sp. XHP0401]MCV2894310.1 sulfite exporter TauE/SafE family protein [Lentibacter sp. XHP0401]
MLEILVLCVAGFATGALNAVAGGGTFISFPALVWLGVPPIMANATATLTAIPGYAGSAWAFRKDISAEGALSLPVMLGLAALGGLIGALLLTVTSEEAFVGLVPWLLLIATVIFAAGPKLLSLLRGKGFGPVSSVAVLLSVSIYGGYFNGGLGIMLLAVFGLMGFMNLHGMNGLKNLMSTMISIVSALALAMAGLIAWKSALVLALATTAGGYFGASYARKITNMKLLRAGIVAVGLIMTLLFFLK